MKLEFHVASKTKNTKTKSLKSKKLLKILYNIEKMKKETKKKHQQNFQIGLLTSHIIDAYFCFFMDILLFSLTFFFVRKRGKN